LINRRIPQFKKIRKQTNMFGNSEMHARSKFQVYADFVSRQSEDAACSDGYRGVQKTVNPPVLQLPNGTIGELQLCPSRSSLSRFRRPSSRDPSVHPLSASTNVSSRFVQTESALFQSRFQDSVARRGLRIRSAPFFKEKIVAEAASQLRTTWIPS